MPPGAPVGSYFFPGTIVSIKAIKVFEFLTNQVDDKAGDEALNPTELTALNLNKSRRLIFLIAAPLTFNNIFGDS